jgi:DNA helicase-2/ATP-dependent DNA helicase PcrA
MTELSSLLSELNKAQKEAVEYFGTPLLISAGAGSGKTRVITYKIAYILKKLNYMPFNILALTFTNKAANEMRERVELLTGLDGKSLWISTFHSFGLRILKKEKREGEQIIIIDRADAKSLLSEIITRLKKDIPKTEIKKVINSIANLKKKGIISLERDILINYIYSDYIDIFIEYQKELEKKHAYDFEDLIVKAYQLLNKNSEIREKYKKQFKYILVDEFQDTSPEQYKFLKTLITDGNLCVVGDEDQSIYSWRGANMDIFLDFPEDFPDTKIIRLEENYRSTKIIIDSATEVIERNTKRIGKSMFTQKEGGNPILMFNGRNKEDEAAFIAQYITDNKDTADFFPVGILYRVNSRSRAIEDALTYSGIKYKIIGSLSFYDRKVVKDLSAYLRLAFNEKDDISFLRAIQAPNRGVGNKTIEKIKENSFINKISYYESLKQLSKQKILKSKKITDFISLIELLKDNLHHHSIASIIQMAVEKTGYKQYLEKSGDRFNSQWENVQELLEIADKFQGDIIDFINTLVLRQTTENISETAKVLLLTIHAAKGLEFNTVILAGSEEGVIPHIMSKDSRDRIEEERRLFYVAMTRAKKRLVLTSQNEWSNFIYSIPSTHLYYLS